MTSTESLKKEDTSFNFEQSSVGIEEYVNPTLPGFHAIIKARFSDFIVREIDMQGNVVTLKDLGVPKQSLRNGTRASECPDKNRDLEPQTTIDTLPLETNEIETDTATTAASAPESFEWTESQALALENMLTKVYPSTAHLDELLESIRSLFDHVGRKNHILLPAIAEKSLRTLLHQYFREANQFPNIASMASFDTLTLDDGQIKVSFGKGLEKKRKRKDELTEPKPKYILFHLLKENRDTMEAIQKMAVFLRIPSPSFSFAGTKDKRGITVQRVSVASARIDIPRLASLNRAISNSGLYIGDFTPYSAPLGLGELKGNAFQVFLRCVPKSIAPDLPNYMQSLKEQGFINYYGMQRFGNCRTVPTWRIGQALLQNKWEEAIHAILDPRESDEGLVTEARNAWCIDKNAPKAYDLFPKRWIAERAVLRYFTRHPPTDALGAILSMPHEMRLMYLHSLQSLIWNKMASKRISQNRSSPMIGDLVITMVKGESMDKDAVKVIASQDEVKLYSMKDVVLPLPGHAVIYPENELAAHYRSYIEQTLGLTLSSFHGKHFSLAGSYRHVVIQPDDLSYEMVGYNEENETVLHTDLDVILGSEKKTNVESSENECKYTGLQLSFSLPPSAYATMALRELLRSETSSHFQKSMTH